MKNTIISIIVLVALLVLILFGFQKFFNRDLITEKQEMVISEEILPVLEIKEQYENGTYTFAGTIDLPTPCYSLKTSVAQVSQEEYQIQINTIAPEADVMCAQVITPQPYNVSFEAPIDIVVTAKIDDQLHELTRFVIPEGEDINLFELYIKG